MPDLASKLAKLIAANKQKVVDDDVYTNQLSKWVNQGTIKRLDVVTIFGIQAADKTITQDDLEHLEGILDSLVMPLNARVDFVAATNNFDLSLTNQPQSVTNLAAVGKDIKRLTASISVPPNSPDGGIFLSLTNDYDQLAGDVAPYTLLTTNVQSSTPYQAFITVGAEFVNPYQINVPNGAHFGSLTNSGNTTAGFVEFDYINRHILRPNRGLDALGNNGTTGKFGLCDPFDLKNCTPDVQFEMGFLFDNGTTVTNGQTYSAQALAGADYYSELTLGFPLWRRDVAEQSHQISLEASGGVTTEKSFAHVHPNAFVGLGYETSFSPFVGSTTSNTCGFFITRVGAGWTDKPSMVGSNNLVNLDSDGNPAFQFKPNWELSAFLAYPLTSKVFLTVEANDFIGGGQVDSWNVKVGASIPLESLSTIFASVLKSAGGSP